MSGKQFIDRVPFWGVKSAPELKFLQQILNNKNQKININRNCFRELLKTLVGIIDKTEMDKSVYFNDKIINISDQFQISTSDLTLILTSLIKLFKFAMRVSSIKQEIVKEDLLEVLKFPAEYVTDFANILYGPKRESIEVTLANNSPQNVTIVSLNWRVDVSISTSSLNRTLEPTVLIQMKLSNGKTICFEMTLPAFHLLRFNVTLVLKEMDDILNRQLFKLGD